MTMVDKFMYIPNLKSLETQLNEPANQNRKSLTLLSQRIRKLYDKTYSIETKTCYFIIALYFKRCKYEQIFY